METNDPNEILQNRLAEIAAGNKGKVADLTKLETNCLALLEDYKSTAQKGKIYAAIAKAYSNKGFSSRKDIRVAKSVNYCKKALEQPLDVITSCEMYSRLADSMMVGFWELPHDQFIELRREVTVVCLKGLKIALDNNAPDAVPDPPSTSLHNVGSNASDRKKIMEEYKAKRAVRRKKWELEYKFFFLRDGLTGLCVSLYSHEPYDINEFQQLSQNILINHAETIDKLIGKIQNRISNK
jgi:hypothetical protein